MEFESKWKHIDERLTIAPGKEVLAALNSVLQARYDVSISSLAIANNMSADDVPADMRQLIESLDSFRSARVDELP